MDLALIAVRGNEWAGNFALSKVAKGGGKRAAFLLSCIVIDVQRFSVVGIFYKPPLFSDTHGFGFVQSACLPRRHVLHPPLSSSVIPLPLMKFGINAEVNQGLVKTY